LARVSYFYPLSGTFQKIYKKGGVGYGVEMSVLWRDCLEGYVTVDEFLKRGRVQEGSFKTTVKLFPLNVGFKYYFPFRYSQFYVGGGPLLLALRVHNETNLVTEKISREDLGFTVKFGNAFRIKEALFDLFVEYSYQKMRFTGNDDFVQWHKVDLSHFKAGLAVGVQF
jgi:hypothetical protein